MPNMQRMRLADASLIYHLREMMEANGWTTGNYEVKDAYPDNLAEITKFPVLTVQTLSVDAKPIQIGSKSTMNVTWAIDIFAKTDGQRDDVAQLLWDELLDAQLNIYDFNNGFPATLGDYTGISTLGTINFESINMSVIEPETFTDTIAEKHHTLVVVSGYMSVD